MHLNLPVVNPSASSPTPTREGRAWAFRPTPARVGPVKGTNHSGLPSRPTPTRMGAVSPRRRNRHGYAVQPLPAWVLLPMKALAGISGRPTPTRVGAVPSEKP